MSDKVRSLFTQHLLTERDAVLRNRRIPEEPAFVDDGEEAFEDSLDQGTDPSEFDTEGLGFDEKGTAEDNFVEVYEKVSNIERFYEDMIDPKNPRNLTRLLAQGDRNDSILNGVIQKLERPILKAVQSAQEVKAVLDGVASREESLRKKIEQLSAK